MLRGGRVRGSPEKVRKSLEFEPGMARDVSLAMSKIHHAHSPCPHQRAELWSLFTSMQQLITYVAERRESLLGFDAVDDASIESEVETRVAELALGIHSVFSPLLSPPTTVSPLAHR